MMNFGWEERNRYNSRMENAQSSLFPLTHPTRYEPLSRETRLLPASKVNSTHFLSLELPTEFPATHYNLLKRPLDLQLSADEFINHVEKLPKNGYGWNSSGPTDSRGFSSKVEDLKLSLSIGGDGNRNIFPKNTFSSNYNVIDLEEDTRRNFFGKKKHFSSRNVIDLEEDTRSNFSRKKTYPSYHNVIDLEKPESGPSLDSYISPKVKHELENMTESSLLQEPFQGLLDLNKALQDESCCSDDHCCLENTTCPTVSRKNEAIECPNEISGILKQDKTVNLALLDLNRNSMEEEDIRTPHSENHSPSSSVVTPESTIRFLSNEKQEVSFEKSAGKSLLSCSQQNSLQEGNKSCCLSDNDSSSGKTQHSVITSNFSDQCIITHLGSQVAEADILVQQAAESLVHILLVDSVSGQDSTTIMESKEKEEPEYSIDSFELNTLNLKETNLDDKSVSSKPLEVKNDAKDFGVKLRRGRRMKDFQKEILPSLASLSRHEILEDVNIMEGALRSREYRKNQGKLTCGDNLLAPLRSRRSRVSYGGRRNYSRTLG